MTTPTEDGKAPVPTPPGPTKLSLRTPNEILSMEFPCTDWILEGRVVARGQACVMAGPPGVGKSRLALQIAVASIVGFPAIGWKTQSPGLWLMLQVENSNRRLRDDLQRLRQWTGDELWEQVEANLKIHTLETDVDGFVVMESRDARERIAALIAETKPAVVVWDCLQSFAAGDLNRDSDMFVTLSFISMLTKAGNPDRVPFVLHHAKPGRLAAAAVAGFDKGAFARNSKALLGWARSQINLAPSGEEARRVIVGCGKLSDGSEYPPFSIVMDESSFIYQKDEEFDVGMWQREMAAPKGPAIAAERVAELAGTEGMTKTDLAAKIMEEVHIGKTAAFRSIQRAIKKGFAHWSSDLGRVYPTGKRA